MYRNGKEKRIKEKQMGSKNRAEINDKTERAERGRGDGTWKKIKERRCRKEGGREENKEDINKGKERASGRNFNI